jgi:hypothetical protein
MIKIDPKLISPAEKIQQLEAQNPVTHRQLRELILGGEAAKEVQKKFAAVEAEIKKLRTKNG